MATVDELNLPAPVHAVLAPMLGDWQVGPHGESVWIQHQRIRMEFEDLGEGWNGDYDEEDPEDAPLLRFSFYAVNYEEGVHGEQVERLDPLDDCSYCTAIDARAPWEVQLACAAEIFEEVFQSLSYTPTGEIDPEVGRSAKRAGERASHTSDEGYDELRAALQAVQLGEDLPPAQGQARAPRM